MQTWTHVSDGGLETDLIFHRGVDLPEFAAYPLIWTAEGRTLLVEYFADYASVAAAAAAGLVLETPTWRANPDWGRRLGHHRTDLHDANSRCVDLLRGLAQRWTDSLDDVQVRGMVGPRGDGYRPGTVDPDEAAEYHLPQLTAFAASGADSASVLTLTDPGEAIGVARSAQAVGLALTVGFTVDTDGRVPGGQTLADAVSEVDAVCPPDSYMINCAHPRHVLAGIGSQHDDDATTWRDRITGLRCNASLQSHAELDEAEELDEGDLDVLVADHRRLAARLPALTTVGGCCGTDARHVAALWGVDASGRI